MDLRQLRYFIAIVEQGSFSRAAALLHIAQPALSMHVKNIETELGASLLFRSAKGVVLTEAGETLLRNARTILDQLAIAKEEINGHQRNPTGIVRLGLPGTISEILSVKLIIEARHRFPQIQLRISEAMSGFVLDWMREGRIDLGIIYRKVAEDGMSTKELLAEELVCFGPSRGLNGGESLPERGQQVELDQVAALPLILPGATHGLRALLDQHAKAADLDLNMTIEVDSYRNIKELVSAGLGCSVLPLNAISREVAAGDLIHWTIGAPPLCRSVHLVNSVDRPMTHAVSLIRDMVQDLLHDLIRTGTWVGATELSATDWWQRGF